MMNTIKNTLATIISKGVGTGKDQVNLAPIGITLQPDGTLKTDEDAALTAAISSNSGTVASLFNSVTGVAATLNNSLSSFSTGGIIDTRTTALNADLKSIADQQRNSLRTPPTSPRRTTSNSPRSTRRCRRWRTSRTT